MPDPDPRHASQTIGLIDDPHAHLSAALVLSLALWMPFGLSALHGDLAILGAGVRYLVAFVGCRFAIGGITHLLRTYRHLAVGERAGEPDEEIPA